MNQSLLYALLTAIFWGLTYSCTEQTTKYVSVANYLLISGIVQMSLFLAISNPTNESISSWVSAIPWIIIGCTSASLASYFSVAAVKANGATFASIIEITYPCFVILFTTIINRRIELSWQYLFGLLLVFAGVVVTISGKFK